MKFAYTPVSKAGVEMTATTLTTDKFKSIQDIFKTVLSGVSWFKPKQDKKYESAISTVLGFDYPKIEALRRSPELHAAAAVYNDGQNIEKLILDSDGRTERASSNTNVKLTLEIDSPDDLLELDTEREIAAPVITVDIDKMELTATYTVPVRELTPVESTSRAKKSDMESFISSDPELAAAFKTHLEASQQVDDTDVNETNG